MVKVIEARNHKEEHPHRTSCNRCKSKLEYTESDLASWPWADYSGDTQNVYFVHCPQCEAAVNVGYDLNLSLYWQQRAVENAKRWQAQGRKPTSHWGDHA